LQQYLENYFNQEKNKIDAQCRAALSAQGLGQLARPTGQNGPAGLLGAQQRARARHGQGSGVTADAAMPTA
jgi:hypothetical protein